jgi:hypothetical protein
MLFQPFDNKLWELISFKSSKEVNINEEGKAERYYSFIHKTFIESESTVDIKRNQKWVVYTITLVWVEVVAQLSSWVKTDISVRNLKHRYFVLIQGFGSVNQLIFSHYCLKPLFLLSPLEGSYPEILAILSGSDPEGILTLSVIKW